MTTPIHSDYTQRLLRVLVHIQQHLDDDPTIEHLAAIAHFSPFHFHRIFSGMVGESVRQYVRRLRLERAAMQLVHSDQAITTIASAAGYEAHESFTRAFHRAFGMSPTAFRERRRNGGRPSAHLHSDNGLHFDEAPVDGQNIGSVRREGKPMKVEIRRIRPMRVAFIRHVGPYDEVSSTWERLCDWAGMHMFIDGQTRLFGACYDDPEITDPTKLRYDACLTVAPDVEPEHEIGVQTTRGGLYAVTLHEGPYCELKQTYRRLFGEWLPSSGYEPADPPCLEFYLSDPESTEPQDLLTDVCIGLSEHAWPQ